MCPCRKLVRYPKQIQPNGQFAVLVSEWLDAELQDGWEATVDRDPRSSDATVNLAHSACLKSAFQGLGMGPLGYRRENVPT